VFSQKEKPWQWRVGLQGGGIEVGVYLLRVFLFFFKHAMIGIWIQQYQKHLTQSQCFTAVLSLVLQLSKPNSACAEFFVAWRMYA
jgi:hypothetical protein